MAAAVGCAWRFGALRGRQGRWPLAFLLAAVILGAAAPLAHAGTIATENALPGTHAWYPLYNNAPAGAVDGYTGQVSYQAGDTLDFHVSTNPAASYRITIYRLGYYQGLGGRQMACLPSCTGSDSGVAYPVPAPDQYGRVIAGWPVTDSMTVPSSWVSGSYVAKVLLTSGAGKGKSTPVPFTIRSTAPAQMLIVSPVNTAEAYNAWGGKSLYSFNSTGGVAAVKVSFDRPYSGNVLFFEQPFVFWLEEQGIDVSYTTDVDVDANSSQLLSERFVLVSGHSEYWSKGDRDAYEAARAAGVNLAFWGGDQGTWQVRYEDADRTLVGYKLNLGDPYAHTIYAAASFQSIGRPECQILGTSFIGGHGYIPSYTVNSADVNDPWFARSGVTAGTTFPGNNFEYDSQAPVGCLPVPITTLFSWSQPGQPQYGPAVRYQWPSGSTVLSVGSFAFSMLATNTAMQKIMLNAILSLDSSPTRPADQTAPSITGVATIGQALTLNPGVWTGSPTPVLTYQWQDCDQAGNNCVPISGAASTTYTITGSDIGSTIDAVVTAANTSGTTSATAAATAAVPAPTPPADQTAPSITGVATVGQTLTLNPGVWTGSPTPVLTYQWQDCDQAGNNCVPIAGATSTTYTVTSADIGFTLDAVVTGGNPAGTTSAQAAATAAVTAAVTQTPPSNVHPPAITGQAVQGQTFTAVPGMWSGSPTPVLTYQWLRCDGSGANCVAVPAATATTYLLGAADAGATIEIAVTATNTAGSAGPIVSAPTAVVTSSGGGGGGLAPATPVLDGFNRASGGAGANWSLVRPTGAAGLNVSGNAAVDSSTSLFAWEYWNPSTFGPDCEAYATVTKVGASDVIRIGARIVNAGTTTASGYYVSVSSTGAWSIIRVDGGPSTTLATGPTQAIAAGDKIGIRIVGSVITALHYTSAGGWTQVLTYDTSGDSTRYTGAGRIAIEFKTSTLDDVGGGTI